jgi:hypothetical protein
MYIAYPLLAGDKVLLKVIYLIITEYSFAPEAYLLSMFGLVLLLE